MQTNNLGSGRIGVRPLTAFAFGVVVLTAIPAYGQNIFEQIGEGVKHVVNEADKVRRDIQPIDIEIHSCPKQDLRKEQALL